MGDAVRVEVIGDDVLAAALKELDAAAAEQALRLAVQAGALLIENAAEAKAPKKTRTLARSITTQITADRNHAEAQIGPSGAAIPYAAQREFGGVIVPKTAKALHWVDEAGLDHFARRVVQVAQPYMRPAWDENIEQARERVKAVLGRLVQGAAHG